MPRRAEPDRPDLAPPFRPAPGARGQRRAGALYAVDGGEGVVFFGQVVPKLRVAFFRFAGRRTAEVGEALRAPVMACIGVMGLSEAVRRGSWLALGAHPLRAELRAPQPFVALRALSGAATVYLNKFPDGGPTRETTADDPSIQDLETASAWDAHAHVPTRLRLDFGPPVGRCGGSASPTARGRGVSGQARAIRCCRPIIDCAAPPPAASAARCPSRRSRRPPRSPAP